MKLPRDVSGADLAKRLKALGYTITRRTRSHMRLTCMVPSEHHITIPDHDSLRVGTLAAIIADVAAHHKFAREQVIELLVGK